MTEYCAVIGIGTE